MNPNTSFTEIHSHRVGGNEPQTWCGSFSCIISGSTWCSTPPRPPLPPLWTWKSHAQLSLGRAGGRSVLGESQKRLSPQKLLWAEGVQGCAPGW